MTAVCRDLNTDDVFGSRWRHNFLSEARLILLTGFLILTGLIMKRLFSSRNDWQIVLFLAITFCGVVQSPARSADPKPDSGDSKRQQPSAAKLRPGLDWPVFLGPQGTGISEEIGLLDEWPAEGPPIIWEKRIGKGYSAPSTINNQLVLFHRMRDRDVIECLNADDGVSNWNYDYETDFSDPYGYSNGPRCSPLLTKNRCYTYGAQGKLVCLELATGKEIWQRDTAREWTVPDHFFGAGCTPILEGDLLIVLVGGQPNSGVVAFNAASGKVVWENVGKQTWDGAETDQPGKPYHWTGDEMIVSYSSPIVATIHGERHLLCLMRQGLVSLNPADGKVRFKYWFRSRTHESVNAARPVVIDDQIFLSAAYETGAALLRVQPDGKKYDVVWRKKRGMSTHWSTPIYRDGCLYGFSGRHEGEATLQCVDLKSGNLLWETNGYDGNDALRSSESGDIVDGTGKPVTFFGRGSKIAADGKYIVLGERGILTLAKINREKYDQISRVKYKQLRYPSWAAPVLSRGRLYLRSEDFLLCIDIAKPAKAD